MATNRRRDGGAGFARACKAALMCSLLAAADIGYVRQTMDQDRLGRLLIVQEARILELKDEYRRQTANHSLLSSPEAIQARVRQHRLSLAPATPQQRLFLTVPANANAPVPVPLHALPTFSGVNVAEHPPTNSRSVAPTLAQLPR